MVVVGQYAGDKVDVTALVKYARGLEDHVSELRDALRQIRARANSLQNADSHAECLRQLACIDHIVKGLGITLNGNGQTAGD